ncbi:hypothetical protein [Dactylosporangium sp. CA-092794]|uniref:hypothetical protein n=1 Tax=Dactylosporangium sp. CA-092794 TaxID=3239929 RepID=UPI003D8F8E84
MDSVERGTFVAAFGRLVADVWSDPAVETRLAQEPRALVADYGLRVPEEVDLRVVRDTAAAEPDLEAQVRAWRDCHETGVLHLYIPAMDAIDDAPLSEDELDDVVAGLDASCACCCPCCCT